MTITQNKMRFTGRSVLMLTPIYRLGHSTRNINESLCNQGDPIQTSALRNVDHGGDLFEV
jgi:hypothetical protein